MYCCDICIYKLNIILYIHTSHIQYKSTNCRIYTFQKSCVGRVSPRYNKLHNHKMFLNNTKDIPVVSD
jgi:hypothetical protein